MPPERMHLLPDEERTIYESAVAEYRQLLADTQWELAQTRGQLTYANTVNAELQDRLDAIPTPPKPGAPTR